MAYKHRKNTIKKRSRKTYRQNGGLSLKNIFGGENNDSDNINNGENKSLFGGLAKLFSSKKEQAVMPATNELQQQQRISASQFVGGKKKKCGCNGASMIGGKKRKTRKLRKGRKSKKSRKSIKSRRK